MTEHKLPESLKTGFCDLEFRSPLVLLSGCVGFALHYGCVWWPTRSMS